MFPQLFFEGIEAKREKQGHYSTYSTEKNAFKDLSGNVELSSVGSLRNSIRDQNLHVIYLDEHQNRPVRQASDRGQMQELSDYNEN